MVKNQKSRTLLIADPHIGWEMELQKRGIYVPSQTSKILTKLTGLLIQYKPDALVILGDIKYTVVSSEWGELQDIPDFFKKLQAQVESISVVRGNHDANLKPLLPKNVAFLPATGAVFGDVGVFHGHTWPSPTLLGCKTLVMGHLHPMVVFRDPTGYKMTKQVWIRTTLDSEALAKTLLQKGQIKTAGSIKETLQKHFNIKLRATELYVMPSFNDFLGGKPVNETHPHKEPSTEPLIGPILRSEAVDVDSAELYMLDGTYLGTLSTVTES
ncbi:MAG: metallophosphoesterase [Nitrososphaerota archaeon]|jgi:putative SbcD/Mre11-related phosphoesterase|nr:metallophosphoesterase [Candidatus Termitimicrobium sp.]MDR0493012.1 metallophosphoesterase [Nitrososphaerota archaeon]